MVALTMRIPALKKKPCNVYFTIKMPDYSLLCELWVALQLCLSSSSVCCFCCAMCSFVPVGVRLLVQHVRIDCLSHPIEALVLFNKKKKICHVFWILALKDILRIGSGNINIWEIFFLNENKIKINDFIRIRRTSLWSLRVKDGF